MSEIVATPEPADVTPGLESLRQQLADVFGPDIGVACRGVDGDPQALWPQERPAVRQAIPRRQREFAAGREAAREAMARIGWSPMAIPAGPDRAPIWPGGLVGSITHTDQICVAVVGKLAQVHAIGVDIEQARPLHADLWPTICTTEEMHTVASLPPSERGLHVTRLFCIKEAFYKWQYPQTLRMLEFNDVQVTLGPLEKCYTIQHATLTQRSFAYLPRCSLMTLRGLILAWVIGAPGA